MAKIMTEKLGVKEGLKLSVVSINDYITRNNWYRIDREYQRDKDVWTRVDKQYLIDTILRGFPMPSFIIHIRDDGRYIVDGQQRLETIRDFYHEVFPLNIKISRDIMCDEDNKAKNNGQPAHNYGELSEKWQERFLNYPLYFIELTGYSDNEIRSVFRRFQRGKALKRGELLNAFPGEIVKTMRQLSRHSFFQDIIATKGSRGRHRLLVAHMMFLEANGIRHSDWQYIQSFFEENADLDTNSKLYQRINRTLNYLVEVFEERTPELAGPAWLISIYLFTRYLLDNYAMGEQKENLKEFIITTFRQIKSYLGNGGDREIGRLHYHLNNARTSEQSIKTRVGILIERFLRQYSPPRLDENRLFTLQQKREIYRKANGKCEICGKPLEFGHPDTQYHHGIRYIDGGKTEITNGMLVCRSCHIKIHREQYEKLRTFPTKEGIKTLEQSK